IEELEVAGSYRRRVETIGDVDVLAAARKPAPVMDHFTAYPGATRVESAGPTRGTIVLNNGMHVDLRVVKPESWGAALHYFTGSKAHNIKVRTLGIQRGLKINEYGIFRETARDGGSTQRAAARGKGGARKSATARKSAAAQKAPAARKPATVQQSPAARTAATARAPAPRRTAGRSAARQSATRRKPALARGGWAGRGRVTSSAPSAWTSSRRSCARIEARWRRRCATSCRGSSRSTTSAATSRCTARGATAATRSRRWCAPRRCAATST